MFVRWGYCRTSTNTLTVVDKMWCIFAWKKFQRCKGWIRILPVFGRICLSIFLQCGHLQARMPIPLLSLDLRLSLRKSSIEDRSVHRDPRTLAVRHEPVSLNNADFGSQIEYGLKFSIPYTTQEAQPYDFCMAIAGDCKVAKWYQQHYLQGSAQWPELAPKVVSEFVESVKFVAATGVWRRLTWIYLSSGALLTITCRWQALTIARLNFGSFRALFAFYCSLGSWSEKRRIYVSNLCFYFGMPNHQDSIYYIPWKMQ